MVTVSPDPVRVESLLEAGELGCPSDDCLVEFRAEIIRGRNETSLCVLEVSDRARGYIRFRIGSHEAIVNGNSRPYSTSELQEGRRLSLSLTTRMNLLAELAVRELAVALEVVRGEPFDGFPRLFISRLLRAAPDPIVGGR